MGKMLLVIPFYHGDRGQVERLGKWMTALSGGKRIGESLLFCGTESADMQGIGENFKGLFDEIKGIRQTHGPELQTNERPWPKACNFQFLHTAKHIYENVQDVDSFYYFEPDNLPLTPDWFDRIQADYKKQDRPFYGVAASYVQRIDDSAWEDGQHMIGTGVYPHNAWRRIKMYEKIEREQPNRPWDALTRDEVNPSCHFTKLICNYHNSRGFMRNEEGQMSAVYRPNLEKDVLRREVFIPEEAVVFHGCKDSSLRLMLESDMGLSDPEEVLTFVHAGDLGDIIYSLPAIRARGGGIIKFSEHGYAREPMTDERVGVIADLLFEQSYIKGIERHDDGYTDYDLRGFRALHKQHSNLAGDQANWIGVKPDMTIPWLHVPKVGSTPIIIVNRTERYRNPDFPWQRFYAENWQAMRFVGLDSEHQEFEQEVGKVSRITTANLLDVAKLISGSLMFVGNQSVCFAIAEGLKHERIQETCLDAMDCMFADQKATHIMIASDMKMKPLPLQEVSACKTFDLDSPEVKEKIRQIAREVVEEMFKSV